VRGVFDTVIFVRGLINPFSPCGRLVFDRYDEYVLIVSPDVVTEYLDVLNRPEVAARYRSAADRDLSMVLRMIANAKMAWSTQTPTVCRDPEDNKFLAAAVAGAAQFIVSEDLDLLALGDHAKIPILSAVQALRILAQPSSSRI
jgi:putative PIN family toxin of toxin-antitoxin system